MKPYNNYRSAIRKTIRRLADNYPGATRFRESQREVYEALERDGWCWMVDERNAKITDKSLRVLQEITEAR